MKKNIFFILASCTLCTLCSCSNDSIFIPNNINLMGTWHVGALLYDEKIIDITEVDDLEDLYKYNSLTFENDGSFSYISSNLLSSYSGFYEICPNKDNEFILSCEKYHSYGLENGEFTKKETESSKEYRISVIDETTLYLEELKELSEDPDKITCIFVKDNTQSQYILDNKLDISKNKGSQKPSLADKSTNAPISSGSPSNKNTNITMTSEQRNALQQAKNYLNTMPFSKSGLIEQLEYEGYSYSDAKYAADNCGADWKEQAVKCAQNYLNTMPFSKNDLINQLEYEGFTNDQASYGVEKVYNSNSTTNSSQTGQKNALQQAKNYLNIMPFSRSGLIEQLEYEGYSYSDAKYAADNCGADWKEQAVKCAQNYLDLMSFSKSQLIEQLEYEGYTHEQAVYGVNQAY